MVMVLVVTGTYTGRYRQSKEVVCTQMHLAPNPCFSEPQFTMCKVEMTWDRRQLPAWRLRSETLGMPGSSLLSRGLGTLRKCLLTVGAQFPHL